MKIINLISYLTLLFSFMIVFVFLYWMIYPYNPIAFDNSPFPVQNKVVKAGDNIIYKVDYCKYVSSSAILTRTFVDQIEYTTPATLSNKDTGCHDVMVEVLVPKNLPPSKYNLRMSYTYKVNPLKEVKVEATTETFEVVN